MVLAFYMKNKENVGCVTTSCDESKGIKKRFRIGKKGDKNIVIPVR